LVVAIGLGYFLIPAGAPKAGQDESGHTLLLHKVERGDFEAFITEPGQVNSSSNVEIRCRVKSPGSAGSAILKICKEGTQVKKDEFLVQFDDSVLQNNLLQQKILMANDESQLTQAESTLDTANRALEEYTEGLFALEVEVLEGQLFAARENRERSITQLDAHKLLRERDFISAAQLRAAEFALEKAKKNFAVATRKLDVYQKFTKQKLIGELKAGIKKAIARVNAAKSTLDLSRQKEAEINQQIADCKIVAPADGQVVYANDRDRRGDPIVIEEGTVIRENQVVIRLPDFDQMQVDVKVNESHYKRVKPGNTVRIELDADPDHPLRGEVKEVAEAPYPVRWHGAPVEYGAVVTIIDPPKNIRPGWRAKVKISFESQKDVLLVPLPAVIVHEDRHYCLIRKGNVWLPREIKIGSNNNASVIVEKGLEVGDQVSLTPFRFIERNDLPGKKTAPGGEPNKLTQTAP
jgi:RND family efflux transporter MFP subunit